MALRQDSFGELKVPLTWMAVVALIVCGVVGVSILLSDRRETFQTEAYGAARQAVDTVSAPVGGAVAAPGRWTGDLLGWLRSYRRATINDLNGRPQYLVDNGVEPMRELV